MQPQNILSDTPAELAEEVVRLVELRERMWREFPLLQATVSQSPFKLTGIRIAILSGRVDDATALLNEHFPAVLSKSTDPDPAEHHPSGRLKYVSPTSVDPVHLSLNLRILAFIEACRTIPLPYTPTKPGSPFHMHTAQDVPHPAPEVLHDGPRPGEMEDHQAALLARAQKLYAAVNMIEKPSDRARYLKELGNVGGLLAYKVPEESPIAQYLSQERREAVAAQLSRAILRMYPTIWHSFPHDSLTTE